MTQEKLFGELCFTVLKNFARIKNRDNAFTSCKLLVEDNKDKLTERQFLELYELVNDAYDGAKNTVIYSNSSSLTKPEWNI